MISLVLALLSVIIVALGLVHAVTLTFDLLAIAVLLLALAILFGSAVVAPYIPGTRR